MDKHSQKLNPMFKLLKKDIKFKWTKECDESFRKVLYVTHQTGSILYGLTENPMSKRRLLLIKYVMEVLKIPLFNGMINGVNALG